MSRGVDLRDVAGWTGLVPETRRRRGECLEDVHPDRNELEERMSGGVDGTRTRGLRRDRPAF
jgi:hypothetical protein